LSRVRSAAQNRRALDNPTAMPKETEIGGMAEREFQEVGRSRIFA
jgi:hypothetical protein